MQERAESLGGRVIFQSAPQGGLEVFVSVPILESAS